MQSRRGRVLALVLAGGEGGRLGRLTDERAKPALSFGGVYRLIDFPLSNCHHSRISDVWVLQQYEPHSLSDHLANGRPWDLDRTFGGLRIMHPSTGDEESGFFEGNADAIHRLRGPIGEFDPELVLVASADAVYRFDYQTALAAHAERRADVTMVTADVPREEAGRFGVVDVSDAGRVTGFAYKPDEPGGGTVTAEVFVYSTDVLLDTLAELDDRGEELRDFGHGLLPALVERGNAWALPLDGYWRDVGTPESYWQAHMDLLGSPPRLDLDDAVWPILTHGAQRPPARLEATAVVDDSLVSPGCVVRGRVERSVLSTGAVVEEGVTVRDAVVLPGARLAADVTRAIVDVDAHVTEPVDGGDEVVIAG